ncbi:8665_t:CDS:2, partial [Ambispora leptoticha]
MLKTIEGNYTFAPIQQKEYIMREQLRQIQRTLDIAKSDDLLFRTVALIVFYSLACLGELLLCSQLSKTKISIVQALQFDHVGDATFATIQLSRTKNHKTIEPKYIRTHPATVGGGSDK